MIAGVVLEDVQGLWGGTNLYLRADGSGIAQVIDRGFERRFGVTAELQALQALLDQHAFFSMSSSTRPGIPDEGHPTLTVTLDDGRQHRVMRWAGDTRPDFAPILAWLHERARESQSVPPLYSGPPDPTWKF